MRDALRRMLLDFLSDFPGFLTIYGKTGRYWHLRYADDEEIETEVDKFLDEYLSKEYRS